MHFETEMFGENLIHIESDFLRALAQPTRLRILYFLKDGEKCACEIIPKMKEDQSNISRHLTHMKDAGILESRKEGVSVYYKIKDKRVFTLLSLVDEMVKAEIKEKARKVKILA
jgi:ArsR family transcriptional regulator